MNAEGNEITNRPLPFGWRWVRLGEVCVQERDVVSPGSDRFGLPYLSLEHVESNTGRILHLPEVAPEDTGISNTFAFDQRHVLYGKLRPYLNKVALPAFVGRCTTEIIPLRPLERVDRNYLCWLLRRQDTVREVMREKTGARMPRADMAVLLGLEVPLPPLPEQRRIAAILNDQLAAVDKARAAAEAQLKAARALVSARFRELFSPRRTADWPMLAVGSVASVSGGLQKTPERAPVFSHKAFLTVRNVQRGMLDLTDVERFEVTLAEFRRCKLEIGDLLIVEGNGSADQIGRNAIFRGEIEDCIHQNHIIRVRFDPTIVRFDFASAYLNSDGGKAQLLRKSETTTGLRTLSVSKVQSLELPVPSLEEQAKVLGELSDFMSGANLLRDTVGAQLEGINSLPPALLGQAFAGAL